MKENIMQKTNQEKRELWNVVKRQKLPIGARKEDYHIFLYLEAERQYHRFDPDRGCLSSWILGVRLNAERKWKKESAKILDNAHYICRYMPTNHDDFENSLIDYLDYKYGTENAER